MEARRLRGFTGYLLGARTGPGVGCHLSSFPAEGTQLLSHAQDGGAKHVLGGTSLSCPRALYCPARFWPRYHLRVSAGSAWSGSSVGLPGGVGYSRKQREPMQQQQRGSGADGSRSGRRQAWRPPRASRVRKRQQRGPRELRGGGRLRTWGGAAARPGTGQGGLIWAGGQAQQSQGTSAGWATPARTGTRGTRTCTLGCGAGGSAAVRGGAGATESVPARAEAWSSCG